MGFFPFTHDPVAFSLPMLLLLKLWNGNKTIKTTLIVSTVVDVGKPAMNPMQMKETLVRQTTGTNTN